MSFATKVADEDHRNKDSHVKCAGDEACSSAGETVASFNAWEDHWRKTCEKEIHIRVDAHILIIFIAQVPIKVACT